MGQSPGTQGGMEASCLSSCPTAAASAAPTGFASHSGRATDVGRPGKGQGQSLAAGLGEAGPQGSQPQDLLSRGCGGLGSSVGGAALKTGDAKCPLPLFREDSGGVLLRRYWLPFVPSGPTRLPVLNQPSEVKAAFVSSGLSQYSRNTEDPLTRSSPSFSSNPGVTCGERQR